MKEKIPFYEVANKFFVGAVFSILFVIVTFEKIPYAKFYNQYADTLKDWSGVIAVVLLVLMYELGFIINRTSAITVGYVLEKAKIWPRDSYQIDVSELKRVNDTFNSMVTELILIRSHVLLYLVLCIVSLVCKNWAAASAFFLIIIMFIVSGKKHNKRINVIRKDYAEKLEKEQRENETGN